MTAAANRRYRSLEHRVAALDWSSMESDVAERGFATAGSLLTAAECAALRLQYAAGSGFRKHVVMARQSYGSGEYRYFDYPLPELVQALRSSLYARLAGLANLWAERLGKGLVFPPCLADFTQDCHAAGQQRPTPLILRYGAGDYNVDECIGSAPLVYRCAWRDWKRNAARSYRLVRSQAWQPNPLILRAEKRRPLPHSHDQVQQCTTVVGNLSETKIGQLHTSKQQLRLHPTQATARIACTVILPWRSQWTSVTPIASISLKNSS